MVEGVPSAHRHQPEVEPVPFIDLVAQHATIETEIQEAVQRVFASQAFVLGDEVAEFECDLAEYCDSRDAIGVASGTDALILSLRAADVGPGDEVITSPFTFFATGGAIHQVGAKPVFVDIEPHSFNLDTEQVETAMTERTRAVMPVHLFGQCAEMEPLWRIAVRNGLSIIEDACQAIGGEYRGRRAGVLGTMGCFSFFPTKNLGGAGDGGLITTDDAELSARLRRLRMHGDVGGYRHVEVGTNSRLDALQAAVLGVKFRHLEQWTEARQQNARRYGELLRHYELLDAVEPPFVLPDRRHVYNQYCLRVKAGRRDEVLASLREDKIGAAIYYPTPLHLQECFAFLGYQQGDFPESEAAADEVLALPIFPELTAEQQETVVRGIATALGRLTSDNDHSHIPAPKFLTAEKKKRAA
ncbi:MAG: DegT/DnrJ/EryC1/StrS family aminotransferase [Planctomycetaceae bacterium]|jgi:dTDP-4-amino-4,6-dideoxygalactose transaminase|nr:DegT/DnrJ/EryC1/StrS family aminotransferase [Planctomycetaceae bacterium]MBT6154580.1 DegT/DnrJ/EryC1/StrS family aminotransferase [Planctomycetaceae bacterium]MBT6487190.1 DegT/DnrJ/EryC1/StrS family aminotransferase [Planctomycetaceae bacterium]MBT6497801.1 DegT/DnrJ/EryC1/StrS family aminotransferase [Planctomycetaceae bacterium]